MKKKILVPVVAMAMLASGVAGGSLAYLMDKPDAVTNTFTVGKVDIDLTEPAGKDNDYRFHMVPGKKVAKDPMVTVEKGSEPCWVFVKIEEKNNTDSSIEGGKIITYKPNTGWTPLAGVAGVYYQQIDNVTENRDLYVLAGEDDGDLKNGYVTTNEDVTNEMMLAFGENTPQLIFTAYAIQQEGFDTVISAWNEVSTESAGK